MKCIIIYTLFFVFMLQTFGCYSYYPLEKKDGNNEYLKQTRRLDFSLNDSTHIIANSKTCRFIKSSDSLNSYWSILGNPPKKISDRDIKEIQVERLDTSNTIILVVSIVAGVALIAGIIALSQFRLNLNSGSGY